MQTLKMLEGILEKKDSTTEAQLRYEAFQRESLRKQESMVLASSEGTKKPSSNPIFSMQDQYLNQLDD